MTDKQIIKEKGNQKCIFYNDDICRKGDKTRDCLNCARVEYHSLYKLNWKNQERLQKIIKHKEQECETLTSQLDFEVQKKECLEQECEELKDKLRTKARGWANVNDQILKEVDQLKADREEALKQLEFVRTLNTVKEAENRKLSQTLTEIKEIAERNIYLKSQLLFYDGDLGQFQHQPIVEILQKINEVEKQC